MWAYLSWCRHDFRASHWSFSGRRLNPRLFPSFILCFPFGLWQPRKWRIEKANAMWRSQRLSSKNDAIFAVGGQPISQYRLLFASDKWRCDSARVRIRKLLWPRDVTLVFIEDDSIDYRRPDALRYLAAASS